VAENGAGARQECWRQVMRGWVTGEGRCHRRGGEVWQAAENGSGACQVCHRQVMRGWETGDSGRHRRGGGSQASSPKWQQRGSSMSALGNERVGEGGGLASSLRRGESGGLLKTAVAGIKYVGIR
jgi:hypothetical protein